MKILILEDYSGRIDAFRDVLKCIKNLELHIWKEAHTMIAEVDEFLEGVDLISLDHDLVTDGDIDPGDGLDFALYLKTKEPVCPVIIHSTNVNRSWSMLNELKDGGWDVERYPPLGMGETWIYKYWINTVNEKLK
ncbi:MAG: hypothetical protein HRT89_24765 [Lentisphaeria bacterium]|nr:hypothetical protein [Lentisphaeria bacterium]NQZ71270.1 hypothetical protein [Lentisphaeria bacterium]